MPLSTRKVLCIFVACNLLISLKFVEGKNVKGNLIEGKQAGGTTTRPRQYGPEYGGGGSGVGLGIGIGVMGGGGGGGGYGNGGYGGQGYPTTGGGCPLCDSSVYSYCSHKVLHDACCCDFPAPYQKPQHCYYSDCSLLYAKSCYEHSLIKNCCCNNPY